MRILIYLILLFSVTPICAANTLEDADNAYMRGHYEEAATLYEEALKSGCNVNVFYNLGNTYYRMEDVGRAILNYERAKILSPSDDDIRFNLELCRTKVIDNFSKPSEMFFITWLKDVVYSKNSNQWGILGIVFFILSFVFFGFYRFTGSIGIRRISFYTAILCFLLVVLFNLAAAWNYFSFYDDQRAVVVTQSQMYKSSNSKDEPIREINPGTIVEVLDKNSRGWAEIKIPNGKKGWVLSNSIIKIVQEN